MSAKGVRSIGVPGGQQDAGQQGTVGVHTYRERRGADKIKIHTSNLGDRRRGTLLLMRGLRLAGLGIDGRVLSAFLSRDGSVLLTFCLFTVITPPRPYIRPALLRRRLLRPRRRLPGELAVSLVLAP